MADAHTVFGNVAAGTPVMTVVGSETVTGGNTSSAAPAGTSVARVTAVDAAVYIAISSGTPDASANPRVYCPVGVPIDLAVAVGEKLDVDAA